MRTKPAHTLAKEYDFENEYDYYNYIIDSLVNGNRQQVKDLFNKMNKEDKADFLINHLDLSIGLQKSCLNICIGELTN